MKLLEMLSKPAAWASGWSSAVLCFSAASGYWLAGERGRAICWVALGAVEGDGSCLVKPALRFNALLGNANLEGLPAWVTPQLGQRTKRDRHGAKARKPSRTGPYQNQRGPTRQRLRRRQKYNSSRSAPA